MSGANHQLLTNTKEKLRLLEQMYEEAKSDRDTDEHLREVELESLKRLINQLMEEITRIEIHGTAESPLDKYVLRNLHSEQELENAREKLQRLEERYEELRRDTSGDARVRELSVQSLTRYINQFKEEIARYEAHQPARR